MSTQKDVFNRVEIPCDINDKTKTKKIDIRNGLVIVGANGAGKTRLGNFIRGYGVEESASKPAQVYYKSMSYAGVSLEIPEIININDNEITSKNGSLYRSNNYNDFRRIASKTVHTFQLSLKELFKEYKCDKIRKSDKTRLEEIIEHFNRYSKCTLRVSDLKNDTYQILATRGDNTYNAFFMSEGERFIFYFLTGAIKQKYNQPEKILFIIDEPENHLHKSIRANFWDEIEKQRTDCKFIYITHDTDFAASRTKAKKIWVKSYYCEQNENGQITSEAWDWEEIEGNEDLPEELLLKLLGSRKQVLFIEGGYSNNDYLLYKALFPDLLIKPVGGCEEVIRLTKAFLSEKKKGKTSAFHHINPFGLIDQDVRVDKEIKSLKEDNVFVMDVAEIENLICVPELLEILWKNKSNWQAMFENIKKLALKQFEDKKEEQILKRVVSEIKHQVSRCNLESSKNFDDLKKNLANFICTDDKNNSTSKKTIDQIHEDAKENFNISETDQYKQILKFYNGKDLADKIAKELGYGDKQKLFGDLIEYIKKSDKNKNSNNRQNALNALKPYLNGLIGAIEKEKEKEKLKNK